MRRAEVQAGARDIAQSFDAVTAQAVSNDKGEYHTAITFGRVQLVISHVDHPSRITRDASFRRTLAESNQSLLFDTGEAARRGDTLCAILIHGSSGDPLKVAFADVVFPVPIGTTGIQYHPDRVHLA